MCGIFGVYNVSVSKDILEVCSNRLGKRGPDGGANWNDGICYLAHKRLSILDLSDNGKQPMVSGNQRYVITYNGEIYNYLEIKRKLQDKGYVFHSDCDTEVILNAYIEYGATCIEQFNGMWAFAIYDRQEKILFLHHTQSLRKIIGLSITPVYAYSHPAVL